MATQNSREHMRDVSSHGPAHSSQTASPIPGSKLQDSQSEWVEHKTTLDGATMNEKQINVSEVPATDGLVTRNWTEQEEKKLKRK